MMKETEQSTEVSREEGNWKFNIGAFVMPQFWSLGNRVWIGLLAWIPILYPIMAIYLGFSGSKLAYEKYDMWRTRASFDKKQKRWAQVSIVYILVVVLMIIYSRR